MCLLTHQILMKLHKTYLGLSHFSPLITLTAMESQMGLFTDFLPVFEQLNYKSISLNFQLGFKLDLHILKKKFYCLLSINQAYLTS